MIVPCNCNSNKYNLKQDYVEKEEGSNVIEAKTIFHVLVLMPLALLAGRKSGATCAALTFNEGQHMNDDGPGQTISGMADVDNGDWLSFFSGHWPINCPWLRHGADGKGQANASSRGMVPMDDVVLPCKNPFSYTHKSN